ncbi:MAG: hypothetical protein IMF16_05645 [Proteobacteria bacterium]|nr:hypothetical protein [Pseudomonadota bacterium]
MTEKSLSDALGIDASAQEALARANVRTLQELTSADPEALAMASGIPIDRLRDWQQRAKRAGAHPKRNPVLTGWMVAIVGLAIGALLGWATMSIGRARIVEAKDMQQQLDTRLYAMLDDIAEEANLQANAVDREIRNSNWGAAQRELSGVAKCVGMMEQIALDGRDQDVSQVRESFDELDRAVREQSSDARELLDTFRQDLEAVSPAPAE